MATSVRPPPQISASDLSTVWPNSSAFSRFGWYGAAVPPSSALTLLP
eukprot:CAMPEP_0182541402 /NCGR_PEP_ID=MMETSP1323-20130603/28597_1 /TAXON_ID=236787 /ORGANISM="Florenciella parvula, Strain RCC1693" /LENGTH=46 /DNA_ID= /DNA_START= /DNA_END= /DNA_ORIENTATION=